MKKIFNYFRNPVESLYSCIIGCRSCCEILLIYSPFLQKRLNQPLIPAAGRCLQRGSSHIIFVIYINPTP